MTITEGEPEIVAISQFHSNSQQIAIVGRLSVLRHRNLVRNCNAPNPSDVGRVFSYLIKDASQGAFHPLLNDMICLVTVGLP
jgi:hypothetical protein